MTTLRVDDEGLRLPFPGSIGPDTPVSWSAIEAIAVHKQDLFNPRIVNLVLRVEGDEFELDEDDCGDWETLTGQLAAHLPGIVPYDAWWPRVTEPERRDEELVIYRRS